MKKILSIVSAAMATVALITIVSCTNATSMQTDEDKFYQIGAPTLESKVYAGINYIYWNDVEDSVLKATTYTIEKYDNTGTQLINSTTQTAKAFNEYVDKSITDNGRTYIYKVKTNPQAVSGWTSTRAINHYYASSKWAEIKVKSYLPTQAKFEEENKGYFEKFGADKDLKIAASTLKPYGDGSISLDVSFPSKSGFVYYVFKYDPEAEANKIRPNNPALPNSSNIVGTLGASLKEDNGDANIKIPVTGSKLSYKLYVCDVAEKYGYKIFDLPSAEIANFVKTFSTFPATGTPVAYWKDAGKTARVEWTPAKKDGKALETTNYKVWKKLSNAATAVEVTSETNKVLANSDTIGTTTTVKYYIEDAITLPQGETATYYVVLSDGNQYESTDKTAVLYAYGVGATNGSIAATLDAADKDKIKNDIKITVTLGDKDNTFKVFRADVTTYSGSEFLDLDFTEIDRAKFAATANAKVFVYTDKDLTKDKKYIYKLVESAADKLDYTTYSDSSNTISGNQPVTITCDIAAPSTESGTPAAYWLDEAKTIRVQWTPAKYTFDEVETEVEPTVYKVFRKQNGKDDVDVTGTVKSTVTYTAGNGVLKAKAQKVYYIDDQTFNKDLDVSYTVVFANETAAGKNSNPVTKDSYNYTSVTAPTTFTVALVDVDGDGESKDLKITVKPANNTDTVAVAYAYTTEDSKYDLSKNLDVEYTKNVDGFVLDASGNFVVTLKNNEYGKYKFRIIVDNKDDKNKEKKPYIGYSDVKEIKKPAVVIPPSFTISADYYKTNTTTDAKWDAIVAQITEDFASSTTISTVAAAENEIKKYTYSVAYAKFALNAEKTEYALGAFGAESPITLVHTDNKVFKGSATFTGLTDGTFTVRFTKKNAKGETTCLYRTVTFTNTTQTQNDVAVSYVRAADNLSIGAFLKAVSPTGTSIAEKNPDYEYKLFFAEIPNGSNIPVTTYAATNATFTFAPQPTAGVVNATYGFSTDIDKQHYAVGVVSGLVATKKYQFILVKTPKFVNSTTNLPIDPTYVQSAVIDVRN